MKYKTKYQSLESWAVQWMPVGLTALVLGGVLITEKKELGSWKAVYNNYKIELKKMERAPFHIIGQ